ncbi:Hypothetical_protein [Hexamita inflata]|uniref:Hypothetical_protein n=1 Tax=Hexamita inflata TaxID=28002 RepID=A0AA86UYN2_9EUKA|nr:Hypothetical protein HINF_LOCUS60944 [Hexamita inflata]
MIILAIFNNIVIQKDNQEVRFVIYKRVRSYFGGLTLFDPEGVSKIESVVGLLQFLQIMLIPDTQDSMQNGFHIPRADLKCEVKKQRKNEQISNFDFLVMLQIRILSLKSYGGYYKVSQPSYK